MPLTQQEMDAAIQSFMEYDKDRSGTIDMWELKDVLWGILFIHYYVAMGQQPTEEELFQMIAEVDDNMSGAIDFSEFLKVVENQKERAEALGDENDTIDAFVACGGNPDKTGVVSKELLKKIIVNDFGMTFDVDGLFENIDTSETGGIEYNDFKKIMNPNA